jgi:hypothetical protein
MSLRIAPLALAGLCACDVSSVVGYNDGALPLVPGGSCLPDASLLACGSGHCVVSEVSAAQAGVETIAVDAENVFFVTAPSVLSRRPLDGSSAPVVLTAELDQMDQLAIDDERVYWTEFDGKVQSLPKAGGPTTLVTSIFGHPTSIAVDAEHVYVVLPESGEVGMAPIPSGPETHLAGQNVPYWIAVDAEHVYWVNQGQAGASNGELVRAPRGDLGGAQVVASNLDAPVALTLTSDSVVWATFDAIFTMPKAGGTPAQVAGGFGEAKSIAAFDGFVYLAGQDGLTRIALADGATLLLEPRSMLSVALTCDGVFATGWYEDVLIRYGN